MHCRATGQTATAHVTTSAFSCIGCKPLLAGSQVSWYILSCNKKTLAGFLALHSPGDHSFYERTVF